MEKIKGYKTPAWAQACMVLASLGLFASIACLLMSFSGTSQNDFSESDAQFLIYCAVALFVWAVPLGALGAILAEIRKYRVSWSQKNGVDADIQSESYE